MSYQAVTSYLSNTATTASYALNSAFAYSSSYASTASVSIITFVTQSVISSSFASSSVSSSYVPLGRAIVLCSAYTPLFSGADFAEIPIPYSPTGGSVTWNIKRATLRAQFPESNVTAINLEYSSGTGVFNATVVGTVILTAGSYEASSGPFTTIVNSGDKVRFNVIILGAAQNWTVIMELSNT
jgi:hypothetical protein